MFVKHAEQLDVARAVEPKLARDAAFIALSLRAWIALREQGLPVTYPAQFLEPGDLPRLEAEAERVARTWFDPFAPSFRYDGIDLGELIRIENITFFREVLASDLIARRIASTWQPSEVALFAEQRIPCLGAYRWQATHDVCEAAFTFAFRTIGVPIRNLSTIDRGRYPFLPLGFKRWVLGGLPGRTGRVQPPVRPPAETASRMAERLSRPMPDRCRLVLALGAEVDLLTLAPHVALLNELSGYRAALVNTDSELPSIVGRSGLSRVQPADVLTLPASAEATEHGNRIVANARKAFESYRRKRGYGPASPLSNPLLDVHLQSVWLQLGRHVVPHISRTRAFLKETRPHAIMVANCELARDRATVKIARQLGIPSVAIPHGSLQFVEAYDFETDRFVAWGRASKACLVSTFGKDPAAIDVMGPIHLCKTQDAPRTDAAPERRPGARQRLLVLTSQSSFQCFDSREPASIEGAWRALIGVLTDCETVDLVIKPHPASDHADWYARMCSVLPPARVRFETASRMEDLAQEIDAAVVMSSPTTALLVAQLFAIPTLFVRAGWRDMSWATRSWGLPDGLQSADRVDEVDSAIRRLLFDEDFRVDCRRRGRRLLDDHLQSYGNAGPASEFGAVFDTLLGSSARVSARAAG